MQNDYLNNKKDYNSNKIKKYLLKGQYSVSQRPINVSINTLLNRIKIDEKNRKKENLILFGFVVLVISITGIFVVV
tara:strand:+ start:1780 stop:2007 length:228 start_codon:yes stop_codon:yes gene_type:complete